MWFVQLVLRENDLVELPKEVGDLTRLRELHIQGNRLTVLPPEIGEYPHELQQGLDLAVTKMRS
jgi:Leucine-rich repeat (LRR) protein